MITFSEVPEEVSLCINITGCQIKCPKCHSKWLWENVGDVLDTKSLGSLIKTNEGITCVCLLGGDHSVEDIITLSKWIKENTSLKVCWYSGQSLIKDLPLEYFDFIKTGSYKEELGGLDSITTNQRFYEVKVKTKYHSDEIMYRYLEDITYKFQKERK